MRLDKFLVEMETGTRSQVKQYIKKGMVTVNDIPAKSPDMKIDENQDIIKYNNRQLTYNRYKYFLLNKPAGYVSATRDNVHPTVIDLLKGELTRDLFPVGRLDIDTEGLLIITNDGALSHRLLSPAHHIPKTYYAEIDGYVTSDVVDLFKKGVNIGDEDLTLPAELHIIKSDKDMGKSSVELTITEGRFHQVKRMFQSVNMTVTFLRRISMGSLNIDESLPVGSYRVLSDIELQRLQNC